jgi:4-amino-4-deoxy-L-arabinose transferase-like glycosyltransferase
MAIGVTLFALALAIRLVFHTGLIASDDLWYATFSNSIATSSYELVAHHFSVRYGLLFPVAAVFRVFGVHEWTVVVVPLVASSLAVAFTGLIALRLSGPSAAWVAGLLLATLPIDVKYATVLVPEPILQAMVLGGALLFLRAERQRSVLAGLTAGALLAFAYLTKETGAFVAVAFFAYALVRRDWRLATAFASGVAMVLVAEVLWYVIETGDPLFRFNALGAHNESQGAAGANATLSWRLFKAYPHMMLVPNSFFGLHSLGVLLLVGGAMIRRRFPDQWLFLVLWAALPFLYLNFGSTSLDRYWVIPAGPRYVSLIYAPLFILGAVSVAGLFTTRWRYAAMAGVAAVCVAGVFGASRLQKTGHNTAHVQRLKNLLVDVRRDDLLLCEMEGRHKTEWRMVLRIIAPDRVGCGPGSVRLVPDEAGLPLLTSGPGSSQ